MNWLGTAGVIGAGAVIATALASGGAIEPETAVIAVPAPKVVETTQKPVLVATTSNNVPTEIPTVKEKSVVAPKSATSETVKTKPVTSSCHPGYSGCLKMNAGDYDCESGEGNGPNYTGPVEVYGSDPFGLDGKDNDGLGCE